MLEADIRHKATCARARGRQGIGPLSLVLEYAVREVSARRLPLLSSVCLLLRVPLAWVLCLCPCELWLCWSCPLSLSLCWSCVSRVNSLVVSCACGLCGAASLLLAACLCPVCVPFFASSLQSSGLPRCLGVYVSCVSFSLSESCKGWRVRVCFLLSAHRPCALAHLMLRRLRLRCLCSVRRLLAVVVVVLGVWLCHSGS